MEIILLIGLPGSGKSTWRKEFCHQNPGYVVISTDAILEDWAKKGGTTYDDMWNTSYMQAAEVAASTLTKALHNGQNIIVDRTNLIHETPEFIDPLKLDRKGILDRVPQEYRRVAVIFDETADTIEARRLARYAEGKPIPAYRIENMRIGYQPPLDGEFDLVITPAQFAALRPQPESAIKRMESKL